MTEQSPAKSAGTSGQLTVEAAAPTSPLAEADAQSLEVLFSRDPFEMLVEDEAAVAAGGTGRNFPTIVAALRRQREAWRKAEAEGKTRGPAAPKAAKAKVTTTLAELGLED